jgi:hypothetical protein
MRVGMIQRLACRPVVRSLVRPFRTATPMVLSQSAAAASPNIAGLAAVAAATAAFVAGMDVAAGSPAAADAAPKRSKPDGARILCLHGINLNMFGKRDPATYGSATLADINGALRDLAKDLNVEVECYQTNMEGELVERIHRAHIDGDISAVIINAGAWTHYSYGMRDALAILKIPIVEVSPP